MFVCVQEVTRPSAKQGRTNLTKKRKNRYIEDDAEVSDDVAVSQDEEEDEVSKKEKERDTYTDQRIEELVEQGAHTHSLISTLIFISPGGIEYQWVIG